MCGFEGTYLFGPVAQLVRAPPCHGGGRGFESHPGRFRKELKFNKYIWDLSSAGRASALQAEGHRFEPYRPHSHVCVRNAAVAEQADAQDLKSCGTYTPVPVRFRSAAVLKSERNIEFIAFLFFFCFQKFEHL